MGWQSWGHSARVLLSLLVGLSAGLVGAVGWTVLSGLARIEAADNLMYGGVMGALQDAYVLRSAVEHEVVGVRGYALTGDMATTRPWMEGRADFRTALADLRSRAIDPTDRALLRKLAEQEVTYCTHAERIFWSRPHTRDLERLRALIAQGDPLRAALDATVNVLLSKQSANLAAQRRRIGALQRRMARRGALLSGLAIAIILGLSVVVFRRVVVPLRELHAASNAFGRGEWQARLRVPPGGEFADMAQAFNSMADQVAASLLSLQTANLRLQEADRSKDRFLAVISHELRTPLNAILGFSEILSGGMVGTLTEAQNGCLDRITRNSRHMQEMITELLDASEVAAGELSLTKRSVRLRAVLGQAIERFRSQAIRAGIALESDLEADRRLEVDPTKLERAVGYLLDNALKFTPSGGTVRVTLGDAGPRVRVAVRDTGPGIAPEDRERLFRSFVQLDMSTQRRTGGTGLGLMLVKAIVEAHGGELGLESQPGEGSTFWIMLPAEGGQVPGSPDGVQ